MRLFVEERSDRGSGKTTTSSGIGWHEVQRDHRHGAPSRGEIHGSGKRAAAELAGRTGDEATVKPETPADALERLARARDEALVALSPGLRRQDMIRRGINPAAFDEEERLRSERNDRQERPA